MTVNYTRDVASSRFGGFLHLLLRWKGSVYKLLWKDFLVYSLAYFILSFTYRYALKDSQKRSFEVVCLYCAKYAELIPIAFLLGFYLRFVMHRWWRLFEAIPWPDRTAVLVNSNIQGDDDMARLMRRTLIRYCNLSFTMVMSSISPPVARRFPSFQHLTDAGLMLPTEQKILENTETSYNKYFIPITWANHVITTCRTDGLIKNDYAMQALIDELMDFRSLLGDLLLYDWISAPLTYTQVVTIAVFAFFLAQLMGAQFLDIPPANTVPSNAMMAQLMMDHPESTKPGSVSEYDMYVPVFLFLQFFFYQGWLKVAESHLHPFGDDDDDFDVNTVIDRNIQICYLMVDVTLADIPKPDKDRYWDDKVAEIPYFDAIDIKPDQALFDMGSAALYKHSSLHDIDDLDSLKDVALDSSGGQVVDKGTLEKKLVQQRSSGLKKQKTGLMTSFTSFFDPVDEDDDLSQSSRTGIAIPKKQTGRQLTSTYSQMTMLDEEVVENVNDMEFDEVTPTNPEETVDLVPKQTKEVPSLFQSIFHGAANILGKHPTKPETEKVTSVHVESSPIPLLQTTTPSMHGIPLEDKLITLGDFVLEFDQDSGGVDGAGRMNVQFIPATVPASTNKNLTISQKDQDIGGSDISVIYLQSNTETDEDDGEVQL